ncbi:hypothetical protein [Streptomyces sp. NPDC058268]|uniref:hypothetical protein n=1 Tax=Streptomyces sp. NPDC058268 TaxID=3346413 RepID=UPI0036E667AF
MSTTRIESIQATTTAAGHQAAVSFAMCQLLWEHPELPPAHWTISSDQASFGRQMNGHLQEEHATLETFQAYVQALGAEIESAPPYAVCGGVVRAHVAKALWRGVRVEVLVVLPAKVVVETTS